MWKSLSCVCLFVTPWTTACQAPLSMEFSRQKFRSGWSEVKVAQSCPTLCNPMDYTVHRILQVRILEWVAIPSPGDLPNPGIEPRSPALQVDSLPAELQCKLKNTGMGCHTLLQIFLTQGSNPRLLCLLHCRQILYHWATSCSLFQGIFPTQGSNSGLPDCGLILYFLSHRVTTYTQSSLFFLKHMPWR